MSSYVGSFSSLGIGTNGIDLNGMLTQLQASENQRLQPYNQQKDSFTQKISSWGDIKSALSDLQKSATALSGSAFNTFTTNTTNAFTATASTNAHAGVSTIAIEQLAKANMIESGAQSDADTDIGGNAATVTITQGDGSEITVELDGDQTSLNDIAKAINKENGDVNATVVTDEDGSHLQLASTKTGTDGAITQVSVSGNDDLNAALGYDSANPADPDDSSKMQEVIAAQDAILNVNGKEYHRSENKITDIIPGVTLSLDTISEVSSDSNSSTVTGSDGKFYKTEQLVLTQDNSAIEDSIKDFVDKYNALNNKMNSAAQWTPSDPGEQDDTNGPLVGDSVLRDLSSLVRGDVSDAYGSYGNDEVSALADIGITIDASTGSMTLNEDKLSEALETNQDQVQKMFEGTDEVPGLAATLANTATDYLGDSENNISSIIKDTTDGINDQLNQVNDQIALTQDLIDNQMDVYRKQFQNLDQIMSQMNSTSSALISALSNA